MLAFDNVGYTLLVAFVDETLNSGNYCKTASMYREDNIVPQDWYQALWIPR